MRLPQILDPAAAPRGLPARDLVLVGGGHAHVQLLKAWAMRPLAGVQLSLVADQLTSVYSGMIPGLVAGQYSHEEISIDLARLAARAGARLIQARATRVDAVARRIELLGRPPLRYDVASLNVGSTSRGDDLVGVELYALPTRPIAELARSAHLRMQGLAPGAQVCVVGGGAAGVELAFCCQAWLAKRGQRATVQLLDAGQLLPGHTDAVRQLVLAHAERRGLELRTNTRVAQVRERSVLLVAGDELEADLVLWAGGAAPPPLITQSKLSHDARGFLMCDATLQVEGAPGLFAAGDCAVQRGNEWVPRAGVYAVRQGPVLDHNLRAFLTDEPLKAYAPQGDFLSLLNLGDGQAIGSKWGRAVEGEWVWRLKDAIDRRFVAKFGFEELSAAELAQAMPMGQGEGDMECGGCAAKLGQDVLGAALQRVFTSPAPENTRVLLGVEHADDVAVWQTDSGEQLMATVDGFTAFTQDHYLLGRVAAVNALSDIWAKAGVPQLGLCTLGIPEGTSAQQEELVFQVLSGVRSVFDQHAVALAGGHTQRTEQLNVGLAVWGKAGSRILRKRGAEAGDTLILTKALGTGVLLHADMLGACHAEWRSALHASLVTPNLRAGALAAEHAAHACTDVTGFGLLGHLLEVLGWVGGAAQRALGARIQLAALPVLPGALSLLSRGYRSTFHEQNAQLRRHLSPKQPALREAAASSVTAPPGAAPLDATAAPVDSGARHARTELLFDPQTSGGLLIAVAAASADALLGALRVGGAHQAAVIGSVSDAASLELY